MPARKTTTVLWVLVLVFGSTTFWLWRALAEERTRANLLQAQVEEQESLPATVTADFPEMAAPAVKILEKSNEDVQSTEKQDFDAVERRLLLNEHYREARRRFRHLELKSGHIDLAKVMQISPETADRLIGLFVEQELRYLEKAHPNPRNEEELRVRKLKIEQAELEQDAEIAALIGADKLVKWKEYQASLVVRHQVRQFGAKLFAAAEPLREDQIEPLIAAIHAERVRASKVLSEYTASLVWSGGMESKSHAYRNTRQLELAEAANKRIHEKASSILSPSQLTILDDILRRQFELEQAEYQMYRVQDDVSRVNSVID